MNAPKDLIEKLQRKIHRMETVSRIDDGSLVRSGCPAVDRMLPEGGYRRGTLIEWFTPGSHSSRQSGGYGADFLSLQTAAKACEDGGALVIIDSERQFYPPAAIALGINSGNLIILRPASSPQATENGDEQENQNDLYWAIDQALRCPAVAAVWGPLDHIGERWFRRFQLAAESSGTLGLFIRSANQLSRPSWAEVQWQLTEPTQRSTPAQKNLSQQYGPRKSDFRNVQLKLLRCRGTATGHMIDLHINTITGRVSEKIRTQSDYERHPESQLRNSSTAQSVLSIPAEQNATKQRLQAPPSEKGPLSMAAKLADSKNRRRTKRA